MSRAIVTHIFAFARCLKSLGWTAERVRVSSLGGGANESLKVSPLPKVPPTSPPRYTPERPGTDGTLRLILFDAESLLLLLLLPASAL